MCIAPFIPITFPISAAIAAAIRLVFLRHRREKPSRGAHPCVVGVPNTDKRRTPQG